MAGVLGKDNRVSNLERNGTIALVAATVLVAISIILDGMPARIFNGIAGLTWFSAAALLASAAWRTDRRAQMWGVAIVLTALVAFVVKPTSFMPAIVGFGVAGCAIALVVRRNGLLWAKVVVGLYLPLHIGTAVMKAVYRNMAGSDSSIRTDPPPTAAVVPMVMLAAAIGGAIVAQWMKSRRSGNSMVPGHR